MWSHQELVRERHLLGIGGGMYGESCVVCPCHVAEQADEIEKCYVKTRGNQLCVQENLGHLRTKHKIQRGSSKNKLTLENADDAKKDVVLQNMFIYSMVI